MQKDVLEPSAKESNTAKKHKELGQVIDKLVITSWLIQQLEKILDANGEEGFISIATKWQELNKRYEDLSNELKSAKNVTSAQNVTSAKLITP